MGEFRAPSKSGNCSRIVALRDVQFEDSAHSILTVTLRYSKTDQRGKSAVLRFYKNGSSPLCPVQAVIQYLCLRPQEEGPLFTHFDGSPLTTNQFRRVFQKCIRCLGLPSGIFSPHSFRIGAATEAAINGVPNTQIQSMGRWRSHALQSYIRPDKVLTLAPLHGAGTGK